jgi:hypothetical protein
MKLIGGILVLGELKLLLKLLFNLAPFDAKYGCFAIIPPSF